MSGGVVVFLLIYLGSLVWCTVIGAQKGKGTMMVCGWLLFTPLIYIGACRIAKPNSKWAREKYTFDPAKQQMSKIRFPQEWLVMNHLSSETS